MTGLATTYTKRGTSIVMALLLAAFALVAACTLAPVQNAYAAEGSISLQYTATDTGEGIDGLDVYAYKVATVEGQQFVATPNFKAKVEQLGWTGGATAATSDAAWLSKQAKSLDAKVRENAPEPDAQGVTQAGSVVFSGLDEGLYLVLTVTDNTEAASGSEYKYSSDLLQVGGEGAELNLQVAPKVEKQPKVTSIKVIKHWKGDTGKEAKRPASIKVQLFDGLTKVGEEVALNEANKWTYTWEGLDAEASHNWAVSEIDVPEGYTFAVEENADSDTFTITNTLKPPTVVEISKQEVGGGPELPGATLVVKDEAGNTIEEWVSGDTSHKVELEPGTYTLTEITAPEGYEIAETITFRVNEDGTTEVQVDGEFVDAKGVVVMFDAVSPTEVIISKQEVGGGPELPGAELEVFVQDADGNFVSVEKWTSGSEPHKMVLEPGIYKLVENQAPLGYDVAEEIFFRVNKGGTTDVLVDGEYVDAQNKVVMFDAPIEIEEPPTPANPPKSSEVTISKQEVGGGPELPGATLVVRDANGKVVDQWVSTTEPRKITLEPGTYTLTEITAPDGYDIAETITFRVNEDGTVDVLQDGQWVDAANHVVMFDAPIPVTPPTPNNPPTVTYPPAPTTVTGKLPQTGQLWWPVPVLLAAGLVSVGAGRIVSTRSRAK